MKNMKVSMKLIFSFLVVIVLAIIVGTIGILGMYSINAADDDLYNGNYLPTVIAGNISQLIVEQRVYIRNFVIYDAANNADTFRETENNMTNSKTEMSNLLKEYDATIVNPEDEKIFREFEKAYNDEWIPLIDRIRSFGAANETESAKKALSEATQIASKIDDLTTKLQQINLSDGEIKVDGNTSLFVTVTTIEVIVLFVAIAIALLLAFYISGLISKPLTVLTNFMQKASTTGDIVLGPEDIDIINRYSQNKDETGVCIASTSDFIKHVTTIADELGAVADRDLTIHINTLSEKDVMGVAMQKMVDNLNNMFSEINSSTAQVSTGSKQIADGAQALAQGSTEQAAAVEQLSSSISEIALKTQKNAEKAVKAADLSGTIRHNAQKGSEQMNLMMEAVKEINDASNSINKVIKVIDDIAFQTNILALNAAVEAARAGQHGKGFAVVAEEVRSLAAKSAEAAKDTGGLIASSIEKAQLGARIADETAASLNQIVAGVNESTEIVNDIARSSEEQSAGIKQINTGIDQVAQVVQQNSATAQESAAASEEMSGQANMLEELISQFKLKDSNRRTSFGSVSSTARQYKIPAKTTVAHGEAFGKY